MKQLLFTLSLLLLASCGGGSKTPLRDCDVIDYTITTLTQTSADDCKVSVSLERMERFPHFGGGTYSKRLLGKGEEVLRIRGTELDRIFVQRSPFRIFVWRGSTDYLETTIEFVYYNSLAIQEGDNGPFGYKPIHTAFTYYNSTQSQDLTFLPDVITEDDITVLETEEEYLLTRGEL